MLSTVCLAVIPKVGDVTYWTDPDEVAVDGNRIFVSSYLKGVGMFDLTNPAEPVETLLLPWDATTTMQGGLAAAGDRFYVGSTNQFRIYDISLPTQPVLLGQVQVANGVRQVFLDDTMALVRDWGDYCFLVNVANAAAPVAHIRFEAGEVLGFVDGYLCTADVQYGLQVWDVQNPDAPLVVASVLPANGEFLQGGGLLAGHTAYCRIVNAGGDDWGFRIIDLSNPLAPVVRGATNEFDVRYQSLTVIDSILYVPPMPGTGIAIWDVRDLDAPAQIGICEPSLLFQLPVQL